MYIVSGTFIRAICQKITQCGVRNYKAAQKPGLLSGLAKPAEFGKPDVGIIVQARALSTRALQGPRYFEFLLLTLCYVRKSSLMFSSKQFNSNTLILPVWLKLRRIWCFNQQLQRTWFRSYSCAPCTSPLLSRLLCRTRTGSGASMWSACSGGSCSDHSGYVRGEGKTISALRDLRV